MRTLLAAALFKTQAYTNKNKRGFYLDYNLQLTFADHMTHLNV